MSAPLAVGVLGARGLLGRAVVTAFTQAGHAVTAMRVDWSSADAFAASAREPLRAFFETCAGPWALVWCAGAGFVGVDARILETETACLAQLLRLVRELRPPHRTPGVLFFSSSAGGVYGSSDELPLTESSAVCPVSAYGHAKLKQEQQLMAACDANSGLSLIVGRFSNLYGANQNAAKPQGLISHIARSIVAHKPINIFVPLDVLRDYLHVRDAAAMVLHAVEALHVAPAGTQVLKLFVTGQPSSVAEILGTFRRLTRRRVPTVLAVRPETALQPRRLVFQSRVHPEWRQARFVPLLEGISEVLTAEQQRVFEARSLRPE